MAYQHYSEVAEAGEATQRSLLETGEPLQQVWAAWALALALGRAADPALAGTIDGSPEPGVRRHLAVILAGHGEAALLHRLAEHDPDGQVRATALQYLTRITPQTDRTLTAWLHARLMADDSPVVRVAVMEGVRTGQRRLPAVALEPLLRDPDRGVRDAALALLVTQHELVGPIGDWLKQRLLEEDDAMLRQHIQDHLIAAGEAAELLVVAALAGGSVQTELLGELVRRGETFTWEQVAPFVHRHQPEANLCLLRLVRPGDTILLPWLLDVILRVYRWQTGDPEINSADLALKWWPLSLAAEERLRQLLPQIDPRRLRAGEWRGLQLVAAGLREYAMAVERKIDENWQDQAGVTVDAALLDTNGDPRLRLLADLEALVARRHKG